MQSTAARRRSTVRSAFTLVEAIIVIAILGTLLALLLPAVQAARAAARANTCKANLHQIGVAISNFEQAKGTIPTWWNPEPSPKGSMAMLLPYLDQQPVWESYRATNGLETAVVEVLLCPDDPFAWVESGQTSYAWNGGTKFGRGNGLFNQMRWTASGRGGITLREIKDGLSSTAAVSERLQWVVDDDRATPSPEALHQDAGRFLWYTRRRHVEFGEEELAARVCRTEATTPLPFGWAPRSIEFTLIQDGYKHLLSPNERGCYNAVDRYDQLIDYSLVPSSSQHAGGVHLLMCDGQVRFVSESIGDAPWRAAGTRDGGEAEGL